MVRRRRWTSVLAATLFLVLALSNGVRAAGDFSSEVPANTFFYLQFGGLAALEEPFKQTAMYAIWQEPEVQALLQGPLGDFKARIESGESNWPLLWAEVRDFLNGPMALAVLPSAEEGAEPGLIVVARPADGEKFRSALAKLIASGKEGRLERAFESLAPAPIAHARKAARRAVCTSNLRQIGRALTLYSEDNDGQLPPSLDALYPEFLPDNKVLECAEAPGVPGYVYVPGLNIKTLEEPERAIVAFDRKLNHENGRNVLFLDVHVQFMSEAQFQQALAYQPNAEALLELDEAHPPVEAGPPPSPPEIIPYTIGSVAVTPLTADADGPAYCFLEDLFVAGLEKSHLRVYLGWRNGPERPALTSARRYQTLESKLQAREATLTVFLDVQAFLQAVAGEMSDEDRKTVSDLGVDGIEWAGATATCDPPGFRNRIFISCPGERTGLLALVPSQPVSEDIFEFAPKTSILAIALRLDAGEFYDRLRRLVGVLSEDEGAGFDEDMAEFREEFGFGLRDDLLAPLGDEFLIYVAPTPLSPFGLDVAVLVRGTEGKRLKPTLESLANVVRQRFEESGRARVQALDVEGHALYSLRLGPTGPPFAPSFGVTDTCAVASLYPGSAQGLMRAAATNGPLAELSLLAGENFKAARAKVSASGLMVSYADVAEYFNVTYRGIMTVVTMRAQELPFFVPFDPTLLPQPETISQHLGGSLSVVSVDEEGFLIDQYSPIITHAGFSPETTGVVAAVMLPALARAREEARKAVCKSNLKNIGLALAIYANDYDDKYPPTLDDLVPLYVTDARLFQCPSDPSEERRYLYVPGLSVAHEPTPIVMFERKGNHAGGRNVLYTDGHVEGMSEEVFQIRWAEQRQKYDLPSLKELGDRIEEE